MLNTISKKKIINSFFIYSALAFQPYKNGRPSENNHTGFISDNSCLSFYFFIRIRLRI
ncbi:hypothetical protein BBUCA112A_KI0072 (plasmid) [Borreliella burgdorferi CA-11.2A]|nr:hypothetical protein BBU72A_I0033 [Borreliella burgdorferi 72a]ACN56115.1 hypothetical protein BBUCA112A_KI0072 [Borreliella burgdorferi CA-11.2A]ACN92073.1 hypothetical protein BBU94A_I30 [Borreliella burgdorferi 94a]